jgi:pimeloyl-ACP methyl ester carboxylesterase
VQLLSTNGVHNLNPDRRIRLSDGRCLGYAEYGNPDGKPVLSFHGGLSSRLDIAFASPFCQAKGIRLLSIDRPGIGLSDFQPHRTILDWADDISELAAQLGLNKFAVLGWSAGGPYVLACALKIPHLLTRAGIAGGMCPVNRPGAVRELGALGDRILFPLTKYTPWLASMLLQAIGFSPAAVLKWVFERELSSPADRKLLASLTPQQATDFFYEALCSGARGTVEDYRILGDDWGFRLKEISTEIILWQGEEDRLSPMKHAKYLAKHLRFSQLVVVPHQGHFLLRAKIHEILATLAP